jgi:1-acyl-sn-glycerol-3-phosphate acyltransferase
VPLAALGMAIFGLDFLAVATAAPAGGGTLWAHPHAARLVADLLLLGVCGGMFSVPMYTWMQTRVAPRRMTRVLAANNLANAGFMVLGAVAAMGLRTLGLDVREVLLVATVVHLGVALYLVRRLSRHVLRLAFAVLVRLGYRLRRHDLRHVPEQGAAVLVCNHVSFVDALLLTAACPRPIRFVMDHRIYRVPGVHQVCRMAGAIPIAPRADAPEVTERAFAQVRRALQAGELVCIFPEGALTADGQVRPFRPGIERILAETPVPVVPLAIRGMWGSGFSRARPGRRLLPARPWPRVEVAAGEPLCPARATAPRLERRVVALRGASC